MNDFEKETSARLSANATNVDLHKAAAAFMRESIRAQYSYNFRALGRPIIQYPQDIVAVQELIWATRPDLVIETGIAHGGSLVLSASMLAILDYCDAVQSGNALDPKNPSRSVLGIDIDIRAHNRAAIEAHPMASRIRMLEGSSIDADIISQVRKAAKDAATVLVFLDSNHTHEHVLAELKVYAPLASPGSYCVVFDTVVADLPSGTYPNRPWDNDNNPKTAVREFLAGHPEFEVDNDIEAKLLVTVAPGGYLRRR
ncbi:MAG: cephalosporin hydroxylase family protein [Proteobacteria bacterium]|nr:cephalosporin hydroxylase family protein [Pseudomonadota bacterium]